MLNRGRTWQAGAELTLTKGGLLRLRCDYDEELVERIKDEVPRGLYRWDPSEGAWFFAASQRRAVRRLLRECTGQVVAVEVEE